MPIEFNHTIVAAHDQRKSAEFVSELFGLPSPKPFGHFLAVALEHGATLDYAEVAAGEEIRPQHYAFLVSEDDFDAIYGKITSRGLQHWADPARRRRARRLLPGPGRPLPGDPHPALRVGQLAGATLSVPVTLLVAVVVGQPTDVVGQGSGRDVSQAGLLQHRAHTGPQRPPDVGQRRGRSGVGQIAQADVADAGQRTVDAAQYVG